MKTSTGKAIQFSGYPLQVVSEPTKPALKLVKEDNQTKDRKPSITDDPTCWDISWFSNYE